MTKLLVTGDLHAHTFSSFSYVTDRGYNSRLVSTLDVARSMLERCVELNAAFVHLGDWFHSRRSVPVEALHMSLELFADYPKVDKYFILGNHDLLFNRGESPYSIKAFERYGQVIVEPEIVSIDNFKLFCLPWITSIKDSVKALDYLASQAESMDGIKLLLGHVGLAGAVVGPDDFAMSGDLKPSMLHQDKYSWCLFGHFHKHQRISTNTYYVGSPTPTSMGEQNEDKHYAVVFPSGKLKFELTRHPKMYRVSANSMSDLNKWVRKHDPMPGSALLVVTESLGVGEIEFKFSKDFCVKVVKVKPKADVTLEHSISTSIPYAEMLYKYIDSADTGDLDKSRLKVVGRKLLDGAETADDKNK